jgi:hypothetical protein
MFIVVFSVNPIAGKRVNYEKHYLIRDCTGKVEMTMPDGTRCDCVTESHAIEYDFADNWYEAIGQSLHYASKVGKRPGIVLIIEKHEDNKYFKRLNSVIEYYNLPIDVWRVGDVAE